MQVINETTFKVKAFNSKGEVHVPYSTHTSIELARMQKVRIKRHRDITKVIIEQCNTTYTYMEVE